MDLDKRWRQSVQGVLGEEYCLLVRESLVLRVSRTFWVLEREEFMGAYINTQASIVQQLRPAHRRTGRVGDQSWPA